ncbi:MAG: flagellar basal body rod protein FlgC [Gammaproteobacteria bacterium]|nr:flagellar basal body rod protein FlgC [Gammaproteobacteria bacterium]MDH4313239.1 flagellar basal body rod protein FlgC [Gammaproteobacteria bacterium]MDH5213555.1 flagellar basal body rod protein FlgC [Gammaproteobacteria bacterium]MDH5501913.1 flagellar basal body rod protein FlgC [Gammaproteobacteria bacterium]
MSLFKVFDVAGSAMNAQSVRLNVTASNLANAGSVSGDPDKVYRARQPVFSSFRDTLSGEAGIGGVRLEKIIESSAPLQMQYQPDHPDADENGNVYVSNVNTVEEMVNMMSASRSYQNNVELVNTTRDMLLQTLSLGS